jgi:catechol 2,3-dioxygenase
MAPSRLACPNLRPARRRRKAAPGILRCVNRLFRNARLIRQCSAHYCCVRNNRRRSLMANPVAPGVRIGHVHLKVADLDRAIGFYSGVLGFELQQKYGDQAAFLSAGGYHHHIGLNTWESLGGSPPPPGHTGLYHAAILYPTRPDLADALRRLTAAGVQLDGASDHGVSEALYLRDPDGNGLELYWDRPEAEWPRDANGRLAMVTRRLNLESLLAET